MIDKKNVEHVAALARIKIDEAEKSSLQAQLSKIIDYIDKLKKLDTEHVEPLRGLHACGNVFREDSPRTSGAKERILSNSPSREGEYFKVPRVIG